MPCARAAVGPQRTEQENDRFVTVMYDSHYCVLELAYGIQLTGYTYSAVPCTAFSAYSRAGQQSGITTNTFSACSHYLDFPRVTTVGARAAAL